MRIPEQLREIAERLDGGGEPPVISVRTLLSWFYAQRRGFYIVREIRQALRALHLRTEPDFEGIYIDAPVRVYRIELESQVAPLEEQSESTIAAVEVPIDAAPASVSYVSGAVEDPTFRVGQLEAANRAPTAVKPDAELRVATTLMMVHDYSQLPVMQNDRDVKGVISWQSIGKRHALGHPATTVRQCMEIPVPEVPAEYSLFSAIGLIVEHGYVLVRQPDRKVSGIVTTSDLSLQFRRLAEPFLLVGEIENYIRRIIDGRFTVEQLISVRDPNDERPISNVADLTFGEYVKLLENPSHWSNLGLTIDRGIFSARLDRVRELRNDIMHFDPDPFAQDDLETLRSFVGFMRDLAPKKQSSDTSEPGLAILA